ncbi:MAG: LysR family transcriptional regulator [Lachnospiraceae bacterium]|nr:LysR family transcriptional regulator [Lachnospiraceae bacterium]
MLETKQLQYFAAAAESSSFSEAAKVLYTTQSNVSKTIASLEKELSYSLFIREAGGIRLTPRGRQFYLQVRSILEELEKLELLSMDSDCDVIRIATNPSSWFARHFSDFYKKHEAEGIRYNIHTDSTFHIMQRIREMEDDIGFVYIFPEEMDRFRYEWKRYQLDFEILGKTPAMLYFMTEDMAGKENGRIHVHGQGKRQEQRSIVENGSGQTDRKGQVMRNRQKTDWQAHPLIQMEMDPFRRQSDWKVAETGEALSGLSAAVTTNSDYIMNIMMKQNGLSNISPKSFTEYPKGEEPGITLSREEGEILYGVMTRKDMAITGIRKELIEEIQKAVSGEE